MNKLLYISVFVLALCAIVVTATSSEEEKFTLEQLLAQPQTLDKAKLTAFSYTNCGTLPFLLPCYFLQRRLLFFHSPPFLHSCWRAFPAGW